MKCFFLLLWLAVASPMLYAADHLLLRVKQSNTNGTSDYELVYAQRGQFAASIGPAVTGASYIVLTGYDRDGKALFSASVRNQDILHAESFDPDTNRIESARDVLRPTTYFEVRVPDRQDLAYVQVVSKAISGQGDRTNTVSKRFNRSQIETLLGSVPSPSQAHRAVSLYHSGSPSRRMDVVLIGDGYARADQGKWQADAQKIAQGLLADSLFKANRLKLNIWRVDVESQDSGVSEPDQGIYKRTALGSSFNCDGIARLLCADDQRVYQAVGAATAADARDLIVVVANSPRYGGSGGGIAVMSMHEKAIELALHEIGHTAFGLADEYDYGTCANNVEPREPNVTTRTERTGKWGALIPRDVPVPTAPGAYPVGTVGLFVGARYCVQGMYRPTENSRMRVLGQPWYAVNERAGNAVFAGYVHAAETQGE
ncbi:M64 family metallopeptidase [Paludibacterium purpuratum]|uniref:IgA peptidase M64 n=1 Tax=Paludibacterium purpuratum TaxID=1144873 RepID=A0A4R7B3P0_9NEIS|nr:M64 family metallopeptidase [Paludibacterium purpuratum]TDR78438.1 IgA peptidase M64 [Paludibacterium purpuratum]